MDPVRAKMLRQALAKAIAFQAVGNKVAMREWARRLIELIEAEFLSTESVT